MTGRKRFGDRYDGRLIRTLDPFYKIIPYIMKTRTDAQNFFEDKIDIENIESYLRTKRNEGEKHIGFLHVLVAAIIRTISQKPGLNRFIAGQKIYARNKILVSLAIKKQHSDSGLETTIKVRFSPEDTIYDVVDKLNCAIEENKKTETKNDADKTAKLFMKCPGMLVNFLVWLLKSLDYFGFMPRIINEVSPFHTSVFVTDLGSLGIQPVYHHLYEFGTTSVFIAFGSKYTEKMMDENHEIKQKRYISLKTVTDERIVDGFYYANAFKYFRRLLLHPEMLEKKPDQVIDDML